MTTLYFVPYTIYLTPSPAYTINVMKIISRTNDLPVIYLNCMIYLMKCVKENKKVTQVRD
jgi:hypothetical protein